MGKRGRVTRPSVVHRKGDPAPPRPRPAGHMVATPGDRDESCALYPQCLAAHVQAHTRSDPPASCPTGCRWREALEERATDYMRCEGWETVP